MKEFAKDTLRFSSLATDMPDIELLPPLDVDTIWSLVDYSTMSSSTHVSPISSSDPINSSWVDLFGEFETTGSAWIYAGPTVAQAPTNGASF